VASGSAPRTIFIDSSDIKNNSILSNDIRNLTIRTDDLSNRLITADKIADVAVQLRHLDAEVMAQVETSINSKIAAISVPTGPRAYGRVNANGSVDSAVSKNLTARKSGNKYCVAVAGVTDATKIAPVVSAYNDSVAAVAVVTTLANCNSGEFGVGVYFSGSDVDNAFNVYVP
jgi:hypothetical protein